MSVTFQGNPVTLKGSPLKAGDAMPEFTLTGNGMNPVHSKELKGLRVFVVVPSLDTGVCDLEVKKFNEKASQLGDVGVFCVSLDLPFAQARWCGAAEVNAVTTLSDYRDRNFGLCTGTLIEELLLLTRAVFIVNKDDTVLYAEYVPEITDHPDYDKIFEKLEGCTS